MPAEIPPNPQMHFVRIGATAERETTDTPSVPKYLGFYTVYGECFAAWSDIEARLHAIFMILIKSPDYHAASSAFYSTIGFHAKLNMVNDVVKNSKAVTPEDLTEWEFIYEEARRKSRRRNELAHNTVYFGRMDETGSRKMFLGDRRAPSSMSRLHDHDLFEVRDSFYSLGQKIWSLWQRLCEKNE